MHQKLSSGLKNYVGEPPLEKLYASTRDLLETPLEIERQRKKEKSMNPSICGSIGRFFFEALTIPVRFPVPFVLLETVAVHFLTRLFSIRSRLS